MFWKTVHLRRYGAATKRRALRQRLTAGTWLLGSPVCFAALCGSHICFTPLCVAQSSASPQLPAAPAVTSAAPEWSTSVSIVQPGAVPPGTLHAALAVTQVASERVVSLDTRPFHSFAVQAKAGFAGAGVDLATTMGSRANLRLGASFFQYNGNGTDNGIHINGTVTFRAATTQLDIFPFGNGFHISPGLTMYNGNTANALLNVPGGQAFSLGDDNYTSDPTDPVHGVAAMTFGARVAPSLTFGFGNMIPRSGRHWSVPFELGFQYIGPPRVSFSLAGSACDQDGDCGDIATDPSTQANIQQQETDINNEIAPLRFYPIVSVGVAYRFGR